MSYMYNTVLDDNNIIYNEYKTEIHKILPELLDEELNVFGITTVEVRKENSGLFFSHCKKLPTLNI